jgi:hypothetical protein
MDSGVPFSPSFTTTLPMMPTHFMGLNPSTFHNDMQNYDTQFMPWVSSHVPVDMPLPVQSSPWYTYMYPSLGSRGTMALMPISSFNMSHIPQKTLTVGGWNLPSYGSNPIHTFFGANTHMGAYSTYYTPSMYPSSAMSVPSNNFPMTGPHVSPGISYRENEFYGSGYPLYGIHSKGGNIYPHSNIPYHTFVSSQTSVMMPVHTSTNQLGGGYYLFGQGQGVKQDPS